MIELVYAPDADDDLLAIFVTIASDNEGAAERLIDRIRQSLWRLSHYPLSGRARPELGPSVRSLPVGRYVVLHRIEADRVLILRVLHGARDLDASVDENG